MGELDIRRAPSWMWKVAWSANRSGKRWVEPMNSFYRPMAWAIDAEVKRVLETRAPADEPGFPHFCRDSPTRRGGCSRCRLDPLGMCDWRDALGYIKPAGLLDWARAVYRENNGRLPAR